MELSFASTIGTMDLDSVSYVFRVPGDAATEDSERRVMATSDLNRDCADVTGELVSTRRT